MASSRSHILASVFSAAVAVAIGGCAPTHNSSDSGTYPTAGTSSQTAASASNGSSSPAPSASASASMSSAQQSNLTTPPDGGKLRVPAGAHVKVDGPYPPAAFEESEAGDIYIWDIDENRVALRTSIGAGAPNRMVNVTEMPNVASALNNKHRYRLYFVPASEATTLPSTLGQ